MRNAYPKQDWRWLVTMCRALERAGRRAGPVRSKRGLPPSDELYAAGLELAKSSCDNELLSPSSRAKNVRDGLIIALLAARPLRIKNFAGLRVGRHFQQTASGYSIHVPGSECKTGQPIETYVPDELAPWFAEYLDHHRAITLAGRQSDHLWVHKGGNYSTPGALSQRISKLTKRLVGV